MMETQQERTVIVNGGSTGIGRAIAAAFARTAAHVILVGREGDALRATAQMLSDSVSWQQVDVSRPEETAEAVAAIEKAFGTIDVLVNSAGFAREITTHTPLEEAARIWNAEIDTHLKGAFLMSLALAPLLRRPGGRIINISSITAFTGGSQAGALGYAAAKAGLHGLTYALARELSPQGITVNAIAPGFIADTEFTEEWPEERVRSIISQTPVGRPGRVEDVASAALYLASPGASFVTGEILNVNGGWLFGH